MMWTYSRFLISEEDYYKLSKPKKILCSFFACWAACGLSIWMVKQNNPETFYRKIAISPFIGPIMATTPIAAVYIFVHKYREIQ